MPLDVVGGGTAGALPTAGEAGAENNLLARGGGARADQLAEGSGAPTMNADADGYAKEGATLAEAHLALIRASAIDKAVSRERGYRTLSVKARMREKGFSAAQCRQGLLIPMFNAWGECVNYQLRTDEPRLDSDGKPIKYETPYRSRVAIDVHPLLSRPRKFDQQTPFDPPELLPMIMDVSVPLIVTEGLRKADSGVSRGLCCISLLGVSAWHRRPEWNDFPIKDRTVYICFDSDAMEKRPVWTQLRDLKEWLETHGARVSLIYLPPGPHGEKVGLDDFIAEQKSGGKTDAEIRDALLALATSELRRPRGQDTENSSLEMFLVPGQMPRVVDAAEKVLVANAAHLRIFQRGGEVVRVIELERQIDRGGLRRPAGNVQLAPVSTLNLQEIFDRLIAWKREDPKSGVKPADCPTKIPATYLARREWQLPQLKGILEAPIVRLDGTILTACGYDEATGLYFNGTEDWPAILDAPTRADAGVALRELLEPFAEFPFVDEAAAVMVAAILTAIQRRLLESAPLFGFDAPSQRSGKSLLAEAVGIIAAGRRPAAMSVAADQNEFRKAITAVLREGHLVINLDNITHPLGSPDLAKAITQLEYADRLLGANQILRLPTNVLFTATGNNLTFKDDLPSRALLCRIDAAMERPEERTFKIAELPAYLLANRRRLVTAALTILRAYHVAGRPRQDVRPWGGFDQWSREIREPLVWLGLPDPCATRERIIVSDLERELTAEVLRAWRCAFDDRVMLVREVAAVAQDGKHDDLLQALLMVAAKRDDSSHIDARRLGSWCSSRAGRVIDGLRLKPDHKIHRAQSWRVSFVSSVSSIPADENGRTRAHQEAQNRQAGESGPVSQSLEQGGPNSPDSPRDEIEEGSL
jgi:hypothetical protein